MKPILEVKNLNVDLKLGKNISKIVRDSSFEVYPGECLGILGESGSGKSMTVKSILWILDKHFTVPGEARFNGRDLLLEKGETLRRMRGKEISMVLQNPMTCFDPLFRIGDQIRETFRTHTELGRKERDGGSIERLEIMRIRNPEEVMRKYPHQLSGGMLQRVMIGIAVAMQPSLIIADEPTTAIDAITQKEILDEFIRIKGEYNTAMIFISHDLGAISRVADRIIVMNKGRVVDRGTFRQIVDEAKDPYTRLLIEKRKAVMSQYVRVLGNKEVEYA